MKVKDLFRITGLPVLITSLCCLAPIVLVLFGLSTISFAAALTNVLDGQYLWAFILVGLILLAISLVFYFRKQGVCTLDQAKRHRNQIINTVILSLIVAAVSFYLFFYVFLAYIGRELGIWQ